MEKGKVIFDTAEHELIQITLTTRYCECVNLLLKAQKEFGSFENAPEEIQISLNNAKVESTMLDAIIQKFKSVEDDDEENEDID